MNMQQFIQRAEVRGIPASLSRAVIKGLGGWSSFKESAPEVSSYGADSGFGNFIYHSDSPSVISYTDGTVPFARRHLPAILEIAASQAQDFGCQSVAEMIASFRCLRSFSTFEVEDVLMHPRAYRDGSTAVLNALAWYALEETCHAYMDGA